MLNRLKQTADPSEWDRLYELYAPLLNTWLRKYDVQPNDADDLIQQVLMAVSKDLKSFDHNGRPGAFRSWLRTILVYRLRNFWRARRRQPSPGGRDVERQLRQLEDPGSELSRIWNQDHDRFVARQLMRLVEPSFAPSTWLAFYRVAIEGNRPDQVATELGISVNTVFIAKSRVLSRLRQEAEGLVESSTIFSGNG